MGNARSAIKQIATKIIATNAEHGVQQELQKLLKTA
ncbi:HAD hydrolase family protein [Gordonibacter sp.]